MKKHSLSYFFFFLNSILVKCLEIIMKQLFGLSVCLDLHISKSLSEKQNFSFLFQFALKLGLKGKLVILTYSTARVN